MLSDDNSYFSVSHRFNAYLSPWPQDKKLPTEQELIDMQSVGLKLISEVKSLEAGCLLQLRHLDNEAKTVVDYLKLQSRKIDLVLQHVLETETQDGISYHGSQFGGSGIRIFSQEPMELGQRFKLNLFIREELIAILSFVEVTQVQAQVQGKEAEDELEKRFDIDLSFVQILESDIEQLVKASLNVQQKQLKARKMQQG